MQNSVDSSNLKDNKRLFLNYPHFTFSFLPYLVYPDYTLITGPRVPQSGKVNVIVVADIKKEINCVISYQKDLMGRNIGFDDKVYFLYHFPEDFDYFYKIFGFPDNKVEVVKYFCSLSKEYLVTILKKGITSLREGEYFFFIRDELKELLYNSNLSKQDFKIALNICFEMTKNNIRLKKENKKENVFELLLESRYPIFSEYRKNIQSYLNKINNKNVKIDYDRFFEGRKLRINMEIQKEDDFLNILKFFRENKNSIVEAIKILNS